MSHLPYALWPHDDVSDNSVKQGKLLPMLTTSESVHDHRDTATTSVSTMGIQGRSEQDQKARLLLEIEGVFAALAVDLFDGNVPLKIPVTSRTRSGSVLTAIDSELPEAGGQRNGGVSFPGSTAKEAWRFTVILRILELVHKGLARNVVVTKRDIYYHDPSLFLKQSVVDCYVDNIAYTFGVRRSSLNVVAAAKGLVAGSFVIRKADGSIADGRGEAEGLLIPTLDENDIIDLIDVSWILVIEKEATFRTLARGRFYNAGSVRPGIILTGKGYPDLATRSFLHRLSISHPRSSTPPPMYALVDHDADGLGILSTYKHGSLSLAHENDHAIVPRLCWLGVKTEDVLAISKDDEKSVSSEWSDARTGLLRLSARDRRKAGAMLAKGVCAEGGEETDWRRELQVMLMTNVKAEIQLLNGRDEGLEGWLRRKLRDGQERHRECDEQ